MAGPDATLELARGAVGDDPAAVEDSDAGGEVVGLLEVLAGQEDRDTALGQMPRTMFHITARPRGSTPVVGSSRKTIAGSSTNDIARSSRRRIPPE